MGTLANAYHLAGIASPEHFSYVESRRALRAIRSDLVTQVMQFAVQAGGTAALAESQDRLLINESVLVKVMAVRCQSEGAGTRWRLRTALAAGADFVIAAQMDEGNRQIQNYYLVPTELLTRDWLPLPNRLDADHALLPYRYTDLASIFGF